MLQLLLLSGRQAGSSIAARRFPFRIGRSPSADFQLQDEGVWEEHLILHLRRPEGFVAAAQPPASLWLNGEAVQEKVLAVGDVLTLGSVQIRFGFSPPRQKNMWAREAFTWFCLACLCLGQVALIYWLVG